MSLRPRPKDRGLPPFRRRSSSDLRFSMEITLSAAVDGTYSTDLEIYIRETFQVTQLIKIAAHFARRYSGCTAVVKVV